MESPIVKVQCMTEAHRSAREALRQAEIALKEQRERVAEQRRALPENPLDRDYGFLEAWPEDTGRTVALADLFSAPDRSLLVYHFMFNPAHESACPMCSMWMDGFNGVAAHLHRRVDLVLIGKAPPAKLAAWARARSWTGLRMLSSHATSFNRDFGMESDDGAQWPGVSVFRKGADGRVIHRYTGSAILGDGHFRGLDPMNPVWNLLDLTPEGRGDFMPTNDLMPAAAE